MLKAFDLERKKIGRDLLVQSLMETQQNLGEICSKLTRTEFSHCSRASQIVSQFIHFEQLNAC